MSERKPRIVLISAVYSNNLGDGVLALAVEHLLSKVSDASVAHLDISGRNGWGAVSDVPAAATKSGIIKRLFYFLPRVARYLATLVGWVFIFKPRLKSQISQISEGDVDYIVVAGGQLISDIYWNFPLKLSYIISWAERKKIPVSFLAVGVSSDFSEFGHRLLSRAIKSKVVNFVGVRDKLSLSNIEASFSVHACLVPDAGLWAKECFASEITVRNVVGLGISSPDELGLHASLGVDEVAYKRFWKDVIRLLVSKGYEVELFSNGSADDEEYKNTLFSELKFSELDIGVVSNAKRPLLPSELCSLIGSFSGIISHRLHANIIANSYCIPSVGLKWDRKVESYFQLIGKEEYCLDMYSPSDVVLQLDQAIKGNFGLVSIDRIKNDTLISVAKIVKGGI